MKIPELEPLADAIKDKAPDIWKKFYPRRIVCPNGYVDPKYYSLSMQGAVLNRAMGANSETDATIYTVAEEMIKYDSPTYFLDPQFLLAAHKTELPGDMTFGELKMPMPACLFVLPLAFVSQYIRWRIPYVGVSHIEQGMMLFHVPFIPHGDVSPISYAGWYPFRTTIGEVLKDDPADSFHDQTAVELERWKSFFGSIASEFINVHGPVPTPEEEPKLIHDVCLLIAKVVAILGSVETLITKGSKTRDEKRKKGEVVREALWSPNFIGAGYKTEREYDPQGGTHASPIMHWRRGHLHTVLFGPQKSKRERKWYKPVLINPPS